jgi:hypothetical protein
MRIRNNVFFLHVLFEVNNISHEVTNSAIIMYEILCCCSSFATDRWYIPSQSRPHTHLNRAKFTASIFIMEGTGSGGEMSAIYSEATLLF